MRPVGRVRRFIAPCTVAFLLLFSAAALTSSGTGPCAGLHSLLICFWNRGRAKYCG